MAICCYISPLTAAYSSARAELIALRDEPVKILMAILDSRCNARRGYSRGVMLALIVQNHWIPVFAGMTNGVVIHREDVRRAQRVGKNCWSGCDESGRKNNHLDKAICTCTYIWGEPTEQNSFEPNAFRGKYECEGAKGAKQDSPAHRRKCE